MSNKSRVQAINQITNRKPIPVATPDKLGNIWAEDVFNLARMEWALSKNAYKAMQKTMQTGKLKLTNARAISYKYIEKRFTYQEPLC